MYKEGSVLPLPAHIQYWNNTEFSMVLCKYDPQIHEVSHFFLDLLAKVVLVIILQNINKSYK